MGVVFEAEDLRLCRRVALKVLPPSLVGDSARRRRLPSAEELASALESALRELPARGSLGSRGIRARALGVIFFSFIAAAAGIAIVGFGFAKKDSTRAFSPSATAGASARARPLRHICDPGSGEAAAKCGPKETA